MNGDTVTFTLDEFKTMLDIIRVEEREACAKVCENMERNGAWITKTEAAAAIRARGNHD